MIRTTAMHVLEIEQQLPNYILPLHIQIFENSRAVELSYDTFTVACLFLCTFLFGSTRIPRIPVFGVFGPLLPDYSGYPPPPIYQHPPLLLPPSLQTLEREAHKVRTFIDFSTIPVSKSPLNLMWTIFLPIIQM